MSTKATPLTATFLKGVLTDTLMFRETCQNIDADLQPGVYRLNTTAGTFPVGDNSFQFGIVIVFPKRYGQRFQMLISEDGQIATRSWNPSKSLWNSWQIPVYA